MFPNKPIGPRLRRAGIVALVAIAVIAAAIRLSMSAIGWWVDYGDEPVESDILVVLGGDYASSLYAADLYEQGYAPAVWVSRPERPAIDFLLDRLGIRFPAEADVHREILLKKGVPAERIRFYGMNVRSTADEALFLRREYDAKDKKILIVTQRFHARRSRLIFRRFLKNAAAIRVVSTPYEHFDHRWWRDKSLAQESILEIFKTAFFLCGGRFLSPS